MIPECDHSLTYEELRLALTSTPWGKVPGLYGVLKVIAMEERLVSPAAQAPWLTVRSI
jgi:hypothetical protein